MQVVEKLLCSLSVTANYLGFDYTSYAMELILEDKTIIHSLKNRLYPEVANRFETKPDNVERNMRTVTEIIWNRGNHERLNEIAGSDVKNKPTICEMLSFFFTYIKHME